MITQYRKGDSVEAYLESLSAELATNPALSKLMGGVSTASTTSFVAPRLTTVERGLLSPVTGQIIYNTTTGAFNVYDGAWKVVTIT